jgi:hypothetical protein
MAKRRDRNGGDRLERMGGDDSTAGTGREDKGPGRRRKGAELGSEPGGAREQAQVQPSTTLAESEKHNGLENRPADAERRGSDSERSSALSSNLDMVKQFDADGDGKLSESELAAMRKWLAQPRGTNAPAIN